MHTISKYTKLTGKSQDNWWKQIGLKKYQKNVDIVDCV